MIESFDSANISSMETNIGNPDLVNIIGTEVPKTIISFQDYIEMINLLI